MNQTKKSPNIVNDPQWYKDAIIYEVHVRAFFDANNDGVGDFKGLTQKLDYLRQLGITAIWLLPFYPSPLRDDGYDIADYYSIHPLYGNLSDFKVLLKEAHKRGLKVISELVINHTSDQHPWFKRAQKAKPGSSYRNFYVWSDSPQKYQDTRIIFKDFETSNWTWDPVAKAYYWHRFYAHQPDLNFDNPALQKAILQVMDFWFEMGVDGMRLDAVPYLYEREGTDCENLPETHAFLKKLRKHLDRKYSDRMLLAEANQWPEESAAYFGDGDECHMNFHFPLMPRLFMAIRREDRTSMIDILEQTPKIPDNSQWALFLRNHDELTLEMVTDEERDYMYRVYADDRLARINLGIRRRLAPLLKNDRRRLELMYSLLFSLPGTPVLYYGDEMGMGDNIHLGDRNGVRTPMQWSSDRNAGFSDANPQSLYFPVIIDPEYHYEAINVEAQIGNPNSLLLWTQRMINLRKKFQAFGRGEIEFLQPENRKILAFTREYKDEQLLIVANLSRYVQCTELDLSKFRGLIPTELFGNTDFPEISTEPYRLTLGPHSFIWFKLDQADDLSAPKEFLLPEISTTSSWTELASRNDFNLFTSVLSGFLHQQSWFQGKNNKVNRIEIWDSISLKLEHDIGLLLLCSIGYSDKESELYFIPVGYLPQAQAQDLLEHHAPEVIARLNCSVNGQQETGYVYDLARNEALARELLNLIKGHSQRRGIFGSLLSTRASNFSSLYGRLSNQQTAGANDRYQVSVDNNTDPIFTISNQLSLKLYRRLEEGLNSDLETSRQLTENVKFPHSATFAGHLEYQRGGRFPVVLGKLEGHIPNHGSAEDYTQQYLKKHLAAPQLNLIPEFPTGEWYLTGEKLQQKKLEAPLKNWLGEYFDAVRLLGHRTADLHLALTADPDHPDFKAEPMTPFYRRSLYQSLRNQSNEVFADLKHLTPNPQPSEASSGGILLLSQNYNLIQDSLQNLLQLFYQLVEQNLPGSRIRVHGNLYLDQFLWTNDGVDQSSTKPDFKIANFSGEPTRSLEERRLKRSPLRDVASMLRSFHYAAALSVMNGSGDGQQSGPIAVTQVPAAVCWYQWVEALYLGAYVEKTQTSALILEMTAEELKLWLTLFKLDRAVYEFGYELQNRPALASIPLAGIANILKEININE